METMMDGEDVVFLYQLADGVARKSHASHIARTAGLPPDIVTRGAQVSVKKCEYRKVVYWSRGFYSSAAFIRRQPICNAPSLQNA